MPDSSAAIPDQRYARLVQRYRQTRQFTEHLCLPLTTEDYVVQSMADVSPTKWHLAHVSWFFESFILKRFRPGYKPYHPQFAYLFNSYYQSMGERHARPQRGLLTRPTVKEIFAYRAHVDEAMGLLISQSYDAELAFLVELGLQHEQQHQELLLMDIKHVFSCNPLLPTYSDQRLKPALLNVAAGWKTVAAGVYPVGLPADAEGFKYDNETPRHQQFLPGCQISEQLVTNAEWLAFINDGGYRNPALWLSDGWDWLQQNAIKAPLYWLQDEGDEAWQVFTLHGPMAVDMNAPVCHISFYEADAFATWAGARLPLEGEWEVAFGAAARHASENGQFVDSGQLQPRVADAVMGGAWQWTRSNYAPYPGFKPLAGSLGEYNGKFMNNQYVLRGGSCVTSADHLRASYRNFFYPHMRWQFAGLRLAKDISS